MSEKVICENRCGDTEVSGSSEIVELKLALQRMKQIRTCPPLRILMEKGENVEGHIKTCPFCTEWMALTDNAFDDFIAEKKQRKPKSGELWRISKELEGWDENLLYYNAPVVMTLEVSSRIARVALVHPEPALAVPDDIPISGGWFVETWNTFSIPIRYLDAFIKKTGMLVHETSHPPDPPTEIHEFFWKLETETSGFFALNVLDWVVELSFLDSLMLDKEIFSRTSEIMQLAAAETSPGESRQVCVISVREDEPKFSITTAQFDFFDEPTPGCCIFGGCIEKKFSGDVHLVAELWDKDNGFVIAYADEANFDSEGGYFRVKFKGLTERDKARGIVKIYLVVK